MRYDLRPLDGIRSIRTKLGLLVAVAIVVASVLAVIGTRLGVSPWATVPIAVAAALAVTQVLAKGMTSPLREMTLAAQRMAQGDYSQRVHASSRDEVGELARAFNRTADLRAPGRAGEPRRRGVEPWACRAARGTGADRAAGAAGR